jgi:hypothetical protein
MKIHSVILVLSEHSGGWTQIFWCYLNIRVDGHIDILMLSEHSGGWTQIFWCYLNIRVDGHRYSGVI